MTTDLNWKEWHDNIADMPSFDDSGRYWYDSESGLRYDPAINYIPGRVKPTKNKISGGTLDARNIAKFFGGKALRGSAKQVRWGEKIRADKIKNMTEKQAAICCDPSGLMKHAKFWIETRDKKPPEIGEFAEKYKNLLVSYSEAKATNDANLVASIAEEYNALTALWGFK